ncbi:MAG: hypothetical protein FD143_2742 [Ignavibacteria bacterium]|nr:MAG: hypothetical protein FD143_2742 [Ignavibacteria bacterium]KAF0157616.1 MAG: hypothetical protein FD188_2715 [Ignavibacteria bacterium]
MEVDYDEYGFNSIVVRLIQLMNVNVKEIREVSILL